MAHPSYNPPQQVVACFLVCQAKILLSHRTFFCCHAEDLIIIERNPQLFSQLSPHDPSPAPILALNRDHQLAFVHKNTFLPEQIFLLSYHKTIKYAKKVPYLQMIRNLHSSLLSILPASSCHWQTRHRSPGQTYAEDPPLSAFSSPPRTHHR